MTKKATALRLRGELGAGGIFHIVANLRQPTQVTTGQLCNSGTLASRSSNMEFETSHKPASLADPK